ncbi:UTP--glucose-1-phosphate uridylyltransferase [Motilibacter peucedani]|uniref:UTP--glucose-1-phosphate uridylyltransferase n=1 Tax=Motilibacter peucedani TaxID=598650 RepID=A0A420XRV1_9ACTN|nr:UTP--glucose-1-phosphate uridylyltransferase [Motilibacter peucedani]RKS77527.1 UTP--glucose-1-phosphate uridylyltransferase [Motilibacter peucedani]
MTQTIDDETQRILDAYGFDEATFTDLRERVRTGSLGPATNVVDGVVGPPDPADVVELPAPGSEAYDAAREAGLRALRAGEVASVVLNGGMATRFGGVVKGVVEAVDGKSFLEVKISQAAEIAQALGADVPVVVMTSWATDRATREFLAERGVPEPIYFSQYVSLRLEPDGGLFRTGEGEVSPFSPGHGDFLIAFRASGTLQALRERGVKYVMVSNVDNLPARVDPVVIGAHINAGRPASFESVPNEGDVGGAPASVDGRSRVLESMQFPPDFDHSTLPLTNVNTATFDLDALDRDFDLTWVYVEKSVEGRSAVQLERLYHEASRFLPTTFLAVPASGPQGRFLPIKKPDDLVAAQDELRELVARPAV